MLFTVLLSSSLNIIFLVPSFHIVSRNRFAWPLCMSITFTTFHSVHSVLFLLQYLEQMHILTSKLPEFSILIKTNEHTVYLVAQNRRVQKQCVEILLSVLLQWPSSQQNFSRKTNYEINLPNKQLLNSLTVRNIE